MELEENGRLPYLDSMIHRSDRKLTTTVYRKPTHTDRYLPYDSHHPRSAKCSVVASLLKRAEDVITSELEKEAESHRIELELKRNGYPQSFITARHIHRQTKNSKKSTEQPPSKMISVAFVNGTTQTIQCVLCPLSIRVVGRPNTWKWSSQRGLKVRKDKDKENGMIYRVECKDCDRAYIGETCRTVNERVKEHKAHTIHNRVDLLRLRSMLS